MQVHTFGTEHSLIDWMVFIPFDIEIAFFVFGDNYTTAYSTI
jgi:hypothetical protein